MVNRLIPTLMAAAMALSLSATTSAEGNIRTRSLDDIQHDLQRHWDAPSSGTFGPSVRSRNQADAYADNNRQWDAKPSGDPTPEVALRAERDLLKDHHRDWGPDRPETASQTAGR